MLEEVWPLHCHHTILISILTVQICFGDAKSTDEPAQLIHLALFHLVGIRVAQLAYCGILMRHELKAIGQVLNVAIKLRHVLMQV